MFLLKKAIFILAVTGTFLLFGKSAPWDGDAFDWNTVPEQYPGIRHKSYSADVPRPNKINIVRIDLKTPGLKFAVTQKDENHGKPMPDCPRFNIATKREMTRDFMLKHRNAGRNMILAANTAPWSPWEHPHTHIYAANMGLLISDGVQVDCINKKYYRPVFFETKDGAYGMKTFKPGDDYSHVKNAVSGFFFDLFEGNVIQQQHRLMPCCSFGLDKECRYL